VQGEDLGVGHQLGPNVGFNVGLGVDGNPFMGQPLRMPLRRFNDAADINTQLIMILQEGLKEWSASQKAKASREDLDIRLETVSELGKLFEMRAKLTLADSEVPAEIQSRIETLLKRIGAPAHERIIPRSDSVVPADPLRGHPVDGAGQPDGGPVERALPE
jgi:hypothetical protein